MYSNIPIVRILITTTSAITRTCNVGTTEQEYCENKLGQNSAKLRVKFGQNIDLVLLFFTCFLEARRNGDEREKESRMEGLRSSKEDRGSRSTAISWWISQSRIIIIISYCKRQEYGLN